MVKTPQVKPDWNTGIYIGDGVVAAPMQERLKKLNQMFLRYGFLVCPLTNDEMSLLISDHYTDKVIYDIGCDVASGFPFEETVTAYEKCSWLVKEARTTNDY